MTYTNPNYDMFKRDRVEAYWRRKAKEQETKKQEETDSPWSPEKEPIMI